MHCDPTTLQLDIYPKNGTVISKRCVIAVYMDALFTIFKTWNQAKSLLINCGVYYKGILFSHKNNEILSFSTEGWCCRTAY